MNPRGWRLTMGQLTPHTSSSSMKKKNLAIPERLMITGGSPNKSRNAIRSDESQGVALDYGATHTPHIFVFDEEKKLGYTGKIDDNWREPKQVKERYQIG